MSTYTVAQITNYIKNMFAQDFMLNNVTVKGEISNCKYHSSGHIYCTLKDDKSAISVVMFASDRRGLTFRLEDGQSVEITGRIDVYERDGRYQMYAKRIRPLGEGALYEKYIQLKNELEERGMFAQEYKRPIPKYIRKLGVVTAPTGAAVRDIISITKRRNPGVQIILFPALVQGDGAAASIVKGIRMLESMEMDVIIVGRGGGSIEDLWAFNEESVAEAIFESQVPIISAVGHETDFTIADFVADLRAPTPSAAAELAVYEKASIDREIGERSRALADEMYERIREARRNCENRQQRLKALSPANQVRQKRTTALNLEEKLESRMRMVLTGKRHRLDMYINTMKGLSPLDKLSSGYAVATDDHGSRLRSVQGMNIGDHIKIFLSDGYADASVEEVHGSET